MKNLLKLSLSNLVVTKSPVHFKLMVAASTKTLVGKTAVVFSVVVQKRIPYSTDNPQIAYETGI